MTQEYSARERLELFVARVEQLKQLRLVRRQQPIKYSFHWDIDPQLTKVESVEPDEEDLRSFLLLFRQFISRGEPVFIERAFNDCLRFLKDDALKTEVGKAQEAWKNTLTMLD